MKAIKLRYLVGVVAAAGLGLAMQPDVPDSMAAQVSVGQQSSGPTAAALRPYIERQEIAGAVVVLATKDHVVDREAVGYADLKVHKTMRVNDLFWIASMGKAMTAASVMMLVDEGKIKLDDPVSKYLPEFKNLVVADVQNPDEKKMSQAVNARSSVVPANSPITIREILSHTSGLPYHSKAEVGVLDLLPLERSVHSYAAEPLVSQPGTAYLYSNEGINIAGRIIEIVSGMPLDMFMQRRLFEPLGMKDTTFWPSPSQLERLAKTYAGTSGTLSEVPISQLTYPLDDREHRFAFPAGGLFSTGDDVAHFCQIILNGGVFEGKRYLSPESIRFMTTKETGSAVSQEYGFGWNISGNTVEHAGADNTDMEINLKTGLITVFMVQHDGSWKKTSKMELMQSLENAGEALTFLAPDLPCANCSQR
jgi:CubicO group peptidase (beta-lactamase class C family)